MKLFSRFAGVATAATYFLIFVGGLVRVSGAGLGCPDWPRCFGRWIPPTSYGQLPADMDPSLFNFTLAWIEYLNRLMGIGVGLLIAIIAVWALVKYVRVKSIVIPAVLAAFLTAFQGWQGSMVVASELKPIIVSVHMGIALLIVSLLVYLSFQAVQRVKTADFKSGPSSSPIAMSLVAWIVAVVQIVFGAALRGAYEALETANPLMSGSELSEGLGVIKYVHPIFGVLLALVVITATLKIVRRPIGSALSCQSALLSLGLALVQLFLGLQIILVGRMPVVQLLHLWVSSLLVGMLLLQYLALKYEPDRVKTVSTPAAKMLVASVAAAVLLALMAALVVGKADSSRTRLPILHPVPDFSFESNTGGKFGRVDMQGRITLVSFGFASCQGPCPIMADKFQELYDFYRSTDRVQYVKVSVDPERDTLQSLQAYAARLGVDDHRWQFIYAPLDSIVWLSEEGFLLAADNLPMGHSTKLVLVDYEGNIRSYHDGLSDYAVMAMKQNIRTLAREMR